jgi:hypothetical protein
MTTIMNIDMLMTMISMTGITTLSMENITEGIMQRITR